MSASLKSKGRGREIYQWIREGDTPEERALDNPPTLVYFGVDVTAIASANGYPDDGQRDSGSESASVTVMGEQGSSVYIYPDETVVSARVIRVLQAVPDGDEVKSPWCDIEATSSVGSNRVDSMGNPVWGKVTAGFIFDIRLVNIYAQTPDPAGDPTLGQNEYVMVGGGPPFAIPSRIAVNGPHPGATSLIIDYVRQNSGWTVARPLPSALPAIANGQDSGGVFPQFRNDNDGPPGTLMQGNGFSTLNGLPASNSDFGANSVTHNFQGAPLDVSDIEVFYAAGTYTHPVGDARWCQDTAIGPGHLRPDYLIAGFSPIPNWFHYYSQAWPSPEPISYDPQGFGGQGRSLYTPGDDHVHISDDAHGASNYRLWETRPGSGPYVVMVGVQNTYGIDTFASLVTHEATHKSLYESIQAGQWDDTDGDGLPDALEIANNLNPNNRDSTGFGTTYSEYTNIADQDIYCQIQQRDIAGPREADWANDGLNKGTVPGPNPANRSPKTYYGAPMVPPS